MIRVLHLAGVLALVPAIVGPLPAQGRTLLVAVCGGGSVSVPLEPAGGPGPRQGPCCAKGCHAGSSRKRHCSAT